MWTVGGPKSSHDPQLALASQSTRRAKTASQDGFECAVYHSSEKSTIRPIDEIGRRHRRVVRNRLGMRQGPDRERISCIWQRAHGGRRRAAVEGVRLELYAVDLRRDRQGGGRRGGKAGRGGAWR